MTRPLDTLFLWRTIKFGMEIVTALAGTLLFFNGDAVSVGPRVLTNTGHLPGNFQAWAAARDPECAILDFLCDVDRSEFTQASKLVAKVAIERFEPLGEINCGLAVRVHA